jgi:hypothetical protein
MAYIYERGSKWWCRVKEMGKWVSYATPFSTADPVAPRKAKRFAETVQAKIEERHRGDGSIKAGPITVREYLASWIQKRRDADLDWKNDPGRLKHHVLPVIGDLVLANVRAPHIVDLFHKMRFKSERKLAQRSIYNIYSVVSALFRDAALEGLIDASPCILTEAQLGPLVDSDPEWRAGSVFTREEAEALIGDPRIPAIVSSCTRSACSPACGPGRSRRFVGGTGIRASSRSASCSWRWPTTRASTARRARRQTSSATCRCTRRSP